jgi:hypothetical protein
MSGGEGGRHCFPATPYHHLTYMRETNSELQSGELYVEQNLLPCN